MSPAFPIDAAKLTPHARPMLAVDEVLAAEAGSGLVALRARTDAWYMRGDGTWDEIAGVGALVPPERQLRLSQNVTVAAQRSIYDKEPAELAGSLDGDPQIVAGPDFAMHPVLANLGQKADRRTSGAGRRRQPADGGGRL